MPSARVLSVPDSPPAPPAGLALRRPYVTAPATPAGANNSSHISHSTSSASITTRCRTRSKVNPAFLAGDQLLHLASTRPRFEVLEPLAASAWGVVAAWGTVVIEAWLAIGLWLRRTRVVTAVLGAVVHVVLVAAASRGLGGVVSLTVLNGLLVVGYLAYPRAGSVPGVP